jgi:cytochrome c oxidase cbb3-type subunit 1
VRTLSGISMDIGMSLLVINLMMTAITARSVAGETTRGTGPLPGTRAVPIPAGGPAQ